MTTIAQDLGGVVRLLEKATAGRWYVEPMGENKFEQLTYSVNMEDAVRKGRLKTAKNDICKRGHHFTPENTKWKGPGLRSRACITCDNLRRTTPEYREKRNIRSARKRAALTALRQEKPE